MVTGLAARTVTLQIHGLALFMVLGVSLRLLPSFYGVEGLPPRAARTAWWLLLVGVLGESALFLAYRLTGERALAASLLLPWLLLAAGATRMVAGFAPWRRFPREDRSARFVRAAYLWLLASLVMLVLLPLHRLVSGIPFSHAYYGAIRHAITVGFVSQMIIGISARFVPDLCRAPAATLPSLWATFVLVNVGCLLRVTLQTATDVHPAFFGLVGVSGVLELGALTLWGAHVTRLLVGRPAGRGEQAEPRQAAA